MRNLPLFALGLSCLAGCVTAPNLEASLGQFEGATQSAIVSRLGAPQTTSLDEDGLRVLTYGNRGLGEYPDCVANFLLNDESRVVRWNWNGRHCETFARDFPPPSSL